MRRCIVSKDLHPHQYLKQTILVKKKAVKGLTGFLLHAHPFVQHPYSGSFSYLNLHTKTLNVACKVIQFADRTSQSRLEATKPQRQDSEALHQSLTP